MKRMDVVFTKSKKKFPILSWAIRWWTNKPYSHCARKFTIYNDIVMYYQANEGKVNYENEDAFIKKHETISEYSFMVPDEVYTEMSKACLRDAGTTYGFMQNVGIVYVDIMLKMGKIVNNPWKKGRNCSELLYIHVIMPIWGDLGYHPDTIKPHDIENILKENLPDINDLENN